MRNLNIVETVVLLAGKQIHFVELNLNQGFNCHHTCKILVDFEELDTKWMNDPVKIIKYIGEVLIIEMKHSQTGETNVFTGIVCNIEMLGSYGEENRIMIYGASPTIKLDGKPTMDSFINKTLNGIVSEAVQNSGNGGEVVVNSSFKNPIEYICQYEESAFTFFNRLSYLYGENFYYDGNQIHFGKLEIDDPIPIGYDTEMTSFSLKANLLPPNFKRYNYLVQDDEERIKGTRDDVPDTTGYVRASQIKSESFYTSNAILPLASVVDDSDSLLKMVDIERSQTIASMLILRGASQTCKVKIGKSIVVMFPDSMGMTTSPGYFTVVELIHIVDQEGHYHNSFSGIPTHLEYIPIPPVSIPTTSSQRAVVVSNADPLGQGRVQVQFQWQKYIGKNTNWIRIQTPDAGGSDKVKSNRGFVFIPEMGDTVITGFENGDPSLPYVQGSLFTAKIGGGGGALNNVKSLTTRTGVTMKLSDEDGSALLKDPSGNLVFLDGSGNITITAPNTLTINAKDININGENSIKIDSRGKIDVKAKDKMDVTIETEDITLKAKRKIDVTAEDEDITMKAMKNISITADTENVKLTASAKDIEIKATVNIKMEAPSTFKIITPDMNIK